MKKLILMIIAVLFVVSISRAQENRSDFRDRFQLGLKAGVNYSNVYDAQGEEFHADPKFGLAAGIFFAIPIGRYIGIQPEVLFSQKGFKATGKILGNSYDFTRTTNYLDIPILLQVKPIEFLTLLAGPQFSYLMKQKDEFANATMEQEFQNENIRKNILCILGGVDINLSHLVLGARLGWDIKNNNGDGTSTTPRYKNVWYQATLGFRF
ncbi:MAG: porin family protein [Bacteroidota bacterium]|nr:porin family protein [Bacteroidota bacterium]